MSFEEIEHTADRAFRVRGRDLPDLLVNAARAMYALEGVAFAGERSATRDLEVEAIDAESLLVNWLNEILFLEQEHHLVCEKFEIYELKGYHLRARVETRECSDNKADIKAVTFHNLRICKTPAGLEAEVVVDV
jgi:SHS2 domain-containing protein